MTYDETLMTKTVWYYYIENMTQQNIATKLGISRMKVIKLLDSARAQGIIQFNIKAGSSSLIESERMLCEKYGISDVVVAPDAPNPERRNSTIAKAAAMHIGRMLPDDATVNIGYGDTPLRVLNYLASAADNPIAFVTLTGGVNYYLPANHGRVFNAKLYITPAPLIASTEDLAQALRNEPSILEVSRMSSFANITVVGIGGMDESATIINAGILSNSDYRYLHMKGAVGDILCHFFDKDGNNVSPDIERRLISTPIDKLKEQDNVIGVAAGEEKVQAIDVALKQHIINGLVTDESTATMLLAEN